MNRGTTQIPLQWRTWSWECCQQMPLALSFLRSCLSGREVVHPRSHHLVGSPGQVTDRGQSMTYWPCWPSAGTSWWPSLVLDLPSGSAEIIIRPISPSAQSCFFSLPSIGVDLKALTNEYWSLNYISNSASWRIWPESWLILCIHLCILFFLLTVIMDSVPDNWHTSNVFFWTTM